MSPSNLAAARARTDDGLPAHPVAGTLALLIIGAALALLALAWQGALMPIAALAAVSLGVLPFGAVG